MDGWHAYMHEVYRVLLREWLPEQQGPRLKTDLFEEAVSTSHPLPDLGQRSIGLDISFDVARRARGRVGNAGMSCVVADLRALPFKDGSLDGILSGSSLDHFPQRSDISVGLAELARVLSPRGTLVLTLDNPHNPVVWLRNHLPFILLKACGLVPYYVGATLARSEVHRELAAVGLGVDRAHAVAHAPRAPVIWMVKILERLGIPTNGMERPLQWFEPLGDLPTRYLTGYYLAFRVVKRLKIAPRNE
jgi:SAM-dependent methyltransferase